MGGSAIRPVFKPYQLTGQNNSACRYFYLNIKQPMDNINQQLVITAADGGNNFSVAGGIYRVLVGGKQTGGTFAVIDMQVPPGSGPGPHAHSAIRESFYVVEGEVEVKTKEKKYTAKKGDFISIPLGGMVHCFKNRTENMARLICTVLPAGMDEMFEELGTPVAAGGFLPPKPPDEETLKNMKAIAEKYGQELYPPDYLD